MFFISGIYPKRVDLDYYEPIMCSCCKKYGRYEAFMEFNEFSLFFIPLFKFGKKYYARTTCCNSLYLIKNKEKCLMIERGQGHNVFLKDEDLELIERGKCCDAEICPNCGCQINGEYKYCPNCGKPL